MSTNTAGVAFGYARLGHSAGTIRGANIMQKTTIGLAGVIVGMLMVLFAAGFGLPFASAQANRNSSYAEDRALIENLQARYLFALDFKDHDLYVTTFTTDGILDVGNGLVVGREAIKAAVANMPGGRHHITNLVLRVDGNRATGRAAWMHTGKNAEGRMTIGGYGHYEDDLVKVNGEWLFARRRIYNEGNEAWAAPPGNPAW
jgi:SnoaL-like domain